MRTMGVLAPHGQRGIVPHAEITGQELVALQTQAGGHGGIGYRHIPRTGNLTAAADIQNAAGDVHRAVIGQEGGEITVAADGVVAGKTAAAGGFDGAAGQGGAAAAAQGVGAGSGVIQGAGAHRQGAIVGHGAGSEVDGGSGHIEGFAAADPEGGSRS